MQGEVEDIGSVVKVATVLQIADCEVTYFQP